MPLERELILQVRDNPYGDFRSMYKHISMGSWTFSDRDHGWQVSDYTTESLKVTNFCSNTSYTCGMVFHLTLISVTMLSHSLNNAARNCWGKN